MAQDEVRFAARYLFAGDEGLGAVARVDRHIDKLPGLEGLSLLERSVSELSRAA